MADQGKFNSTGEIVAKYFSKDKTQISRREFLNLLIDHYVGLTESKIKEIERVYNSSLRMMLLSKEVDRNEENIKRTYTFQKLAKETFSLPVHQFSRVGHLVNELRQFVWTYKDFYFSKEQVIDCLESGAYRKFFKEKNKEQIEKIFYDHMHSHEDHYMFQQTDL